METKVLQASSNLIQIYIETAIGTIEDKPSIVPIVVLNKKYMLFKVKLKVVRLTMYKTITKLNFKNK